MKNEILELISVFLEDRGYKVDYDDGVIYVDNLRILVEEDK